MKKLGMNAGSGQENIGFEVVFSAYTASKSAVIRQDYGTFVLCLNEKTYFQNCSAPRTRGFRMNSKAKKRGILDGL